MGSHPASDVIAFRLPARGQGAQVIRHVGIARDRVGVAQEVDLSHVLPYLMTGK